MQPLVKSLSLLTEALEDQSRRRELILEFQNLVWNGEVTTKDERVMEVLRELALDLDYYEVDPEVRREDPSYKDDSHAVEDIRNALRSLENLGVVVLPSKVE